MAAIDRSPNFFSYQGLDLAWGPMVDGKLFQNDPLELLESGKYAKVFFIVKFSPKGFLSVSRFRS